MDGLDPKTKNILCDVYETEGLPEGQGERLSGVFAQYSFQGSNALYKKNIEWLACRVYKGTRQTMYSDKEILEWNKMVKYFKLCETLGVKQEWIEKNPQQASLRIAGAAIALCILVSAIVICAMTGMEPVGMGLILLLWLSAGHFLLDAAINRGLHGFNNFENDLEESFQHAKACREERLREVREFTAGRVAAGRAADLGTGIGSGGNDSD